VLLLLQPVGEQGVAAPCVSFALHASCIHVVHIRLLLDITPISKTQAGSHIAVLDFERRINNIVMLARLSPLGPLTIAGSRLADEGCTPLMHACDDDL